MIKSNFIVKKYSAQSVGLSARLPRGGGGGAGAEEWRPQEKEVSSAEAEGELWLPCEGAR